MSGALPGTLPGWGGRRPAELPPPATALERPSREVQLKAPPSRVRAKLSMSNFSPALRKKAWGAGVEGHRSWESQGWRARGASPIPGHAQAVGVAGRARSTPRMCCCFFDLLGTYGSPFPPGPAVSAGDRCRRQGRASLPTWTANGFLAGREDIWGTHRYRGRPHEPVRAQASCPGGGGRKLPSLSQGRCLPAYAVPGR